MNQTKQKEREAYEPPVVTDIAPVAIARVEGTTGDTPEDPAGPGWGGEF